MAGVSGHLDLVVLDDVLLDDSVASAQGGGLVDGVRVEVGLRNESIIAWDVRGCLCRANC